MTMEPLKTYDYLTLARQRIFERVRPLDAEQYAHEFPIGHETLGRTLTHIMISEWYYVQRIRGRDVPPYKQWPIQEENPPPFAAIEAAWIEQADHTRAALSAVRDWSVDLKYRVTGDDDRPEIVAASAADIFTQLVLHEVHHRAQAMNMLRHLGVAVEDLDFNTFFKRGAASP
ncbi:MAG: DinB family protein [Planctomycetota bacterium]|nr:DinB family protein [Planctomycetota bacterium]